MSGALTYLFLATKRNAVRRFLAGLRKPRRAIGTAVTVAFLGLFVAFGARGARSLSPDVATAMLTTLLAINLVLAVASGLSERGIAFRPAEMDFLFPGPFRPRTLVAYRAASEDAASVFAALLFFLLAGIATNNPALALLGTIACSMTAVHVRLTVALLTTQLEERTFRRLRGPARVVGIGAALALGLMIVAAFARAGGLRNAIVDVTASGVARVLLFPAAVVGDLARAEGLADGLPALLGAWGAAAGTLVALLLFQVNFLEASLGATLRSTARRERARSGAPAEPSGKPARSGRPPSGPLFRGAGAVAWRNGLVVRRSLRSVIVSTLLVGAFLFPAYLGGREGRGASVSALFLAALLPMFLSSTLTFDFRGQAAHLPELRALPVSPFRLALAQVAVPSLLAFALQGLFVGVLLALDRVPAAWVPFALCAFAPTTLSLVASMNLAWFVGARLRVAATLFQVLFLAGLAAALGGAYALVGWLGGGPGAARAGAVAAAVGLAALSVRLLGSAFAAYDVTAPG